MKFSISSANPKIEECPDIFVYYFHQGTRFGYQRIQPKDFYKVRKTYFLKLLPDVYNKSNSYIFEGGLLKFSLRIKEIKLKNEGINYIIRLFDFELTDLIKFIFN